MQTIFDVEFDDPTTTLSEMYAALVDRVVDLDDGAGYPGENVYIVRVDSDGDVVVCEQVNGVPQLQSTWAIPQDVIRRATIKLGGCS